MSGFALLVVMYYLHASVYMIDKSVADINPLQAVGLSVALLVVGWLLYDQLCKRLGLEREAWIAGAMVVFIAIVAWRLSYVLSGRAVYIQIGAMLGTIMAANVLLVIIPSQRKLVEAKEQGIAPDPVYGLRGKQRSVHNNYFTLPVLFIMISNHYPMTYGAKYGWAVLIAIMLLAAYVRHFFNLRHRGRTVWAIPVTAMLATLVLAIAHCAGQAAGDGRWAASFRQGAGDRHATMHQLPRGEADAGGLCGGAEERHVRHARADRRQRAENVRTGRCDQGHAHRQPDRNDRRRARHSRGMVQRRRADQMSRQRGVAMRSATPGKDHVIDH